MPLSNTERSRRWREANRQKVQAYDRARYANLSDEKKANRATVYKEWAQGSGKASRINSKHNRRAKMSTQLSEAETLMVTYYYEEAQHLTELTGVPHHVDHIIPLSKGGPHHPWNLKVITAKENLTKGARI